ncbi:WD repeat-containing protein [Ceratobasidium sp. AG-Ba]|nr:WD repeat-containing protein [Ceratobasidium sp. AG-Ba]
MSVRVRTLEIRWHHSAEKNYSEPIYACDFQPLPVNQLKKLVAPRIQQGKDKDANAGPGYGQSYRLVTGGGDNNIRVTSRAAGATTPPQPSRVEYLATLTKHTAAVNVVRFSPNGELIASAGDDGMLAIWSPTDRPVHNFGDSAEEQQYEKEHWRARVVVRATTREVYDLAWSPNGEYIVTGRRQHCTGPQLDRRHRRPGNHRTRTLRPRRGLGPAQRVSGDPELGSVRPRARDLDQTWRVRDARGGQKRADESSPDAESIITSASERPSEVDREPPASLVISTPSNSGHQRRASSTAPTTSTQLTAPLTPATSIASTPVHTSAPMFPPSSSRRSSFSSAAPSPPHSSMSRYGRSPSPMPPLPAIRTPLPTSTNTAAWATKLYGDENFTNFFRRLTFSPDGALMLTPAGQFEDHTLMTVPSADRAGTPAPSSRASSRAPDDPPVRPKRERPLTGAEATVQSSVYIYNRAGLSSGQHPIAHLPGYKRASVAVKFCPLLFELRPNVVGASGGSGEMKRVALEVGKEQVVHVDLGASVTPNTTPAPQPPSPAPSNVSMSGPIPTPSTPVTQPEQPPASKPTGSVFALPYRMLFAVATQDTVMIYDTQQAGPICMFSNLHYSSFTDMAWAPDGQSLMLASSDGYCSLVVFDDVLPLYHTQQHNLQLHSIAASHSHKHSHSMSNQTPVRPSASPAISTAPLPMPRSSSAGVLKRSADAVPTTNDNHDAGRTGQKKRRIAPTTISSLDKS